MKRVLPILCPIFCCRRRHRWPPPTAPALRRRRRHAWPPATRGRQVEHAAPARAGTAAQRRQSGGGASHAGGAGHAVRGGRRYRQHQHDYPGQERRVQRGQCHRQHGPGRLARDPGRTDAGRKSHPRHGRRRYPGAVGHGAGRGQRAARRRAGASICAARHHPAGAAETGRRRRAGRCRRRRARAEQPGASSICSISARRSK